jgi:UDP-2,3-diacylglucosamine hydrolase
VTTTLFISDLHLSDERPAITAQFLEFLRRRAAGAAALYILGDLFEVWLGDDAVAPGNRPVLEGLYQLTDTGVPVYVMHGNRDFLIGGGFARQSGCRLIADPTVIELNGERTLLMHGDTLCTDDMEYQNLRTHLRNPRTQNTFLALPIEQRIIEAKKYRAESRERSRYKPEEIMDVNQQAVAISMRENNVRQLIHGHTHRPAIHSFFLDGQAARRIVLGDWYKQGSALSCDINGCRLESLTFPN